MNIQLPQKQRNWLEAKVAAGRFATIDKALAAAVADFMAGPRTPIFLGKAAGG